MKIIWEIWPEPVNGSQGDPTNGFNYVDVFADAILLIEQLKHTYGHRLRHVKVEVLLFDSKN